MLLDATESTSVSLSLDDISFSSECRLASDQTLPGQSDVSTTPSPGCPTHAGYACGNGLCYSREQRYCEFTPTTIKLSFCVW